MKNRFGEPVIGLSIQWSTAENYLWDIPRNMFLKIGWRFPVGLKSRINLTWFIPSHDPPSHIHFEMLIFSCTAQFEVRAVFCQSNRLLAVVCEYDVDSYALETSGNVCTPGGACGKTRVANSFGHILHNFVYQSKIVYEIYFKLPKFYQLVWFVFRNAFFIP